MKLSVIVPIYNVQSYLLECLQSLSRQSLDQIEVLLVDDGSTDSSGDIARKYAAEHDGFFYYFKENGGLGNARNYGIKLATGDYLAFLDSDDIIPDTAYEDMYALAVKHDCDIVTGGVARFNSSGRHPSGLHNKALIGLPEITHISESPSLHYDTTSTNKIYKRQFWVDEGFCFPEGILYEDIPVAVPAHYRAKKVGVLNRTVYLWRTREGFGASITQQRLERRNFLDRLEIIRRLDAILENQGLSEEQRLSKDKKTLDLDFPLYIDSLERADDDFCELVVREIGRYLKGVSSRAKEQQNAINRLKYYYIENGDIDRLLKVVAYQKRGMKTLHVKGNGRSGFYGKFPFKDAPCSLMDLTYQMRTTGPWVKVKSIDVDKGNVLLRGQAQLAQTEVSKRKDASVEVSLVDVMGNSAATANARIVKSESNYRRGKVSREFRTVYIRNLKYGDFRAQFDLEKLSSLPEGTYYIDLIYSYKGLVCDPVRVRNASAIEPVFYLAKSGMAVSFSLTDYSEVKVTIWRPSAVISEVSGLKSEARRFMEPSTNEEQEGFAIKYEELDGQDALFYGLPHRVAVEFRDRVKIIGPDEFGRLVVNDSSPCYVFSDSRIASGTLSFDLEDYSWSKGASCEPRVKLKGVKHGFFLLVPVESTQEGMRFELDLRDSALMSSLRSDIYSASVICSNGDEIPLLSLDFDGKKGAWEGDGYRYSLFVSNGRFGLTVNRVRPSSMSTLFSRRLFESTVYSLFRLFPIWRKTIVFESSWGDKTDCNPGALYDYISQEHPDYKCYWLLSDERIPLRGAGEKILKRGGWRYYYVLARSHFFVNNANFPDEFEKRKGQIEIQTMHGTPLKTLGLDVPGELNTERKRKAFLRRCGRWDYLVVQGIATEEITRSCYAYEKEYLKTGYPRNDLMHLSRGARGREKMKANLGLDPEKNFVLYAPTWRVRNEFSLKLDLNRLAACLSDKWEFGIRVHQFSAKGFDSSCLGRGVRDFTYGVSMEELLIAADLVITDYSSLMFDCSAMDIPMLFYVYDLEDYRDNLRGFNLDFVEEAPAPLMKTTEEVLSALKDIELIEGAYCGKRARFKRRYCTYEKGEASKAIYEQAIVPNL